MRSQDPSHKIGIVGILIIKRNVRSNYKTIHLSFTGVLLTSLVLTATVGFCGAYLVDISKKMMTMMITSAHEALISYPNPNSVYYCEALEDTPPFFQKTTCDCDTYDANVLNVDCSWHDQSSLTSSSFEFLPEFHEDHRSVLVLLQLFIFIGYCSRTVHHH
jgi:hypothetical protein